MGEYGQLFIGIDVAYPSHDLDPSITYPELTNKHSEDTVARRYTGYADRQLGLRRVTFRSKNKMIGHGLGGIFQTIVQPLGAVVGGDAMLIREVMYVYPRYMNNRVLAARDDATVTPVVGQILSSRRYGRYLLLPSLPGLRQGPESLPFAPL